MFFDKKLTDVEIGKVIKKYGNYFKVTTDIGQKNIVVGCKLHVDAVPLLKQDGGVEREIWGGWLKLDEKVVETNAVWNIRDSNPSMEILDGSIRDKFINLIKSYFKNVFI